MATVTVAGAPVLSGHLAMTLRGAWTLRAKVDTATLPTGRVDIVCDGGLTLSGTVVQPSGLFLDSSFVWIVGGAGGLSATVSGSFQYATIGDPLGAIMRQSGETLSDAVSASLRSAPLDRYILGESTAGAALSSLCSAAGMVTGSLTNWRTLADGSIWIGAETWPAATLPQGDAIMARVPTEARTIVAAAVPTLIPGVDVDGIGRVRSVDHYIEPASVRSWLWT